MVKRNATFMQTIVGGTYVGHAARYPVISHSPVAPDVPSPDLDAAVESSARSLELSSLDLRAAVTDSATRRWISVFDSGASSPCESPSRRSSLDSQ